MKWIKSNQFGFYMERWLVQGCPNWQPGALSIWWKLWFEFPEISSDKWISNFKISTKENKLVKWTEIFRNFLSKISFPIDFPPDFLEFSIEWFAFWKFIHFLSFWKLSRVISLQFAPVSKFSEFLVKQFKCPWSTKDCYFSQSFSFTKLLHGN